MHSTWEKADYICTEAGRTYPGWVMAYGRAAVFTNQATYEIVMGNLSQLAQGKPMTNGSVYPSDQPSGIPIDKPVWLGAKAFEQCGDLTDYCWLTVTDGFPTYGSQVSSGTYGNRVNCQNGPASATSPFCLAANSLSDCSMFDGYGCTQEDYYMLCEFGKL